MRSYMGVGIAIGVGMGAALGVALHDIPVWVTFGAACGVVKVHEYGALIGFPNEFVAERTVAVYVCSCSSGALGTNDAVFVGVL